MSVERIGRGELSATRYTLYAIRWDCCEMPFFVIPAKAGIQNSLISIGLWIPAFAGMTILMYFAIVPRSTLYAKNGTGKTN